jgi:hypothetical protein
MKMNSVNDIIKQQFVPEMALIVYKNSETGSVYIESHRIDAKGQMLTGRPLTLRCITELVEFFSAGQSNIPYGKIPQNMLFSDTQKGQERYVWYNPHKNE